ncbi:transport and Golgi organization 2 homolog [Centruroides sculpturatus]|uniref:transport and Golgi organization 2 homolog n=1 Tax=Centruroides sculpturatus TaxID=218467 RepID=UPI000C6DC2B7|nr:transport and Golgi organization 2 homolog [Centruroides sculpturatus]
MCLLFLYLNQEIKEKDEYLVILAFNRDEYYERPSRCCHFWEKNPEIVGGMDFKEGNEGGTWLAMDIHGKMACILNQIKPIENFITEKTSRGFLVVDYLKSQMSGPNYLRNLQKQSDQYNNFVMVTVDIRPSFGKVTGSYYTNCEDDPPSTLHSGIHIFGNSAPKAPWKKLKVARKKFKEVLLRNKSRSKDLLIDDLFKMLRDNKQYYPDEQLIKDGEGLSESFLRHFSAIYFKDHENLYGSRTHTVILVDRSGKVDYVEKTMQEPIDVSAEESWITTRLHFTIQDDRRVESRL